MLAYVFWHTPAARGYSAAYERTLAEFHAALAASPPRGFLGSAAYALDPVPWLAGEVYEDWYAVESWEDLGALNDAAVDARRVGTHDAAAGVVGNGVAGVYRLRAGSASLVWDGAALWLHKPRGVPYDDFRDTLAGLVADEGGVWERQLLLGPAPEYCALTRAGTDAAPAAATLVNRRPVYG